MTSDIAMFREHLMNLRKNNLRLAHVLAVEGNASAFVRISAASVCAEMLEQLLRDLKELETQPGVFAKRIGMLEVDE